ncbi:iron-sulfur cluster biosynthesis family protein, partial [Enterococcus faecium]
MLNNRRQQLKRGVGMEITMSKNAVETLIEKVGENT